MWKNGFRCVQVLLALLYQDASMGGVKHDANTDNNRWFASD